ncbi:MAG TPA: mechanosensitive ion channel family protein [Ureibacillus sp.]|nr:mechanosensitive ion channel family protein [Ureibacillus sp.]
MALNYDIDKLTNLGISIGILLLFLLLRKIFTTYIFKFILKISKKSPTNFFTHVFNSFEQPIRWLFIIVGVYVALRYFPYLDQRDPLFLKFFRASIIFIISWGLYNMSSASSVLFEKIRDRFDINMDQILIPFLSKGLRFIIIAISFSIIAQEFNYDVNGFVAGLGLGGLAFALAAKDAIANFFGGIVIIIEKPFSIGDWIQTSSVEGIVEDITFRSTSVRTFTQALVTVPNAGLSNSVITNWSKMGKRGVSFNLEVKYDTPRNKLKQVAEEIEYTLHNHSGVHKETIFVKFDQLNTNGLRIFVYFFTSSTVWGDYLKVKEDINYAIMDILEQEGVSLALPISTVIVEKDKAIQTNQVSGS